MKFLWSPSTVFRINATDEERDLKHVKSRKSVIKFCLGNKLLLSNKTNVWEQMVDRPEKMEVTEMAYFMIQMKGKKCQRQMSGRIPDLASLYLCSFLDSTSCVSFRKTISDFYLRMCHRQPVCYVASHWLIFLQKKLVIKLYVSWTHVQNIAIICWF